MISKEATSGKTAFLKVACVVLAIILMIGIATIVALTVHETKTNNQMQTVENGLSAYELAVQSGYDGTIQEWLDSLNGKSAYEIAKENGYEGTEAEWADTLLQMAQSSAQSIESASFNDKGELIITLSDKTVLNAGKAIGSDGKNGTDGKDGKDGKDGADGTSITDVDVNDAGELVLTFSNSKGVNLGKIVGATGAQGPQGEKGETGATGAQGPQGEKGETGATGAQGPQGEKGETGATGAQGPQGEKGDKGDTGAQGPQGEQGVGIQNIQIDNATHTMTITLTNGREFVFENIVGAGSGSSIASQVRINATTNQWEISTDNGTTWTSTGIAATGPQGEKGETGEAGAQGPQGEDGIAPLIRINDVTNCWEISTDDGLTWTTTNVPATGEKGEQGEQGVQGEKGETGATGAAGKDGNGITGITINEDNYLVIAMKEGNPIIIEQSIVGAKGETGATGATGAQGVGIKSVRLTAEYMLVITLTDNTELDPIGPIRGEKGETGATGAQGPQGVGIANSYINSELHLILVLTDGTEIDAGYVGVTTGGNNPVTPTTYTVTFMDWNGTVLKTESVESGKAATAPADPTRAGYVFTGWDKAFSNITTDLIVTAVYEVESTDPKIYGATVTTTAGSTDVNFVISVKNNPGILGMLLSVEYDEDVFTLTKSSNGDATGELTYQKPSKLISGCNFVWYGTETGEIIDGTVLNLVFSVAADAPAGTYPIKITYSSADTYDAEYNTISATVVDGFINVE